MPIQEKELITKNVAPINFLYYETRTTLAELPGLVGHVQQSLYEEAVQKKLFVSGPAYWTYFNFHDTQKPIDLQISLPVAKVPKRFKGQFRIKTAGQFRCIAYTHLGSWEKFSESYSQLMRFIHKQKLCLTGESRELYINIDFENPASNVTEIQIGIE